MTVPTVRDRIVQQACRIVIEPIFEATFEDCSYGFRPNRSAQQAVLNVKEELVRGWYVVDADIKSYFDNIDHDLLMNLVRRRISDKRVCKLIWGWLKTGVLDKGCLNNSEQGTPQGGVISPLLANIYLHVFDRYWQLNGKSVGTLIRYADDFVIICRSQKQACTAMAMVKQVLSRLKLTLHPDKTKIIKTEKEGFDFLGFHFHKCISKRSGKLVPLMWPSSKAMKNIRSRIKLLTASNWLRIPLEDIVDRLSSVIRGWRNYFNIGNPTKQLQALDSYLWIKLMRFYRRKLGYSGYRMREKYTVWSRNCGIVTFYPKRKFGIISESTR